ncbi:MAG: hypothetical protein ACD_72C00077G0002 [uncultured bacterium]|nr:MAG: hypothetical protein ACD_72C00077G0002 [uncultured bacterium]
MKTSKNILISLSIYFFIRIFSYLFHPQTPLWSQSPTNSLLSLLILILAAYLIYKKDERGWYIVAGEIILGGSGGYLSIFGISLRTCLLITSLSIYFPQKLYNEKKEFFSKFKTEHYLILILFTAAFFSASNGLYHNHVRGNIISDLIPYFFLLYLFPLSELWLSDKFRDLGKKAILAAIFGNAILILFTQIGFSSEIFTLQDQYYHWYRDVALGKITDLNLHFYRLVLNEHLLLIPLTIYFIADIIKNKLNKINLLALFSLLFILTNNLTRIYLLALATGILILFSFKKWKRWLVVSAVSTISFLVIFTTFHTIASRGQSLGLEFFGIRLQSIVAPQIEDSSLSRIILLPKILEKIKTNLILGSGTGDTVTIYSPVFKQNITTTNFDWGYLEIWAEMGSIGLLIWIAFIFYTFYTIIKNKRKYNKQILSAVLVAFLIINITSPALFHVFGTLLLIIFFTPVGLEYSHSAGGIIIGQNGKIILVNNKKHFDWWTPPKGGIAENETPLETAKREIFEETGLKNITYIKDLGYFYNLKSWDNKPYFKKNSMFLFKTTEISLSPQDSDNPEAKWFTIDEAINIIQNTYYKNFIIKTKHDLR